MGSVSIDDRTGLFTDDESSGESFDATGMLALPGFIDPHTHAIFAGERSHEYFMRWAGKTYVEITEAGGGIHSTVRATHNATDAELISNLRVRLKEMLRGGASLAEIGQALRHRHQRTTAIYAKVDISALAQLAMPWPGVSA